MTERKRTRIRAQHIGFVFQAFHLMPHRTALENVAMAGLYKGWDRSQRTAAAFETLTAVGLSHRLDAIPATMSGGERQRVAIARAFCTAPSVLLCDEPTGNLDSVSAEAVLTLLEDLNRRGATMIVITHDRDVAHRASRLLSIRDGRLSEVPRAHT